MQQVAKYTILEQVSENSSTQVFRAFDEDKNPYILKMLREEHFQSDRITRFQKEYEIGKRIHSIYTLKSIDFFTFRGRPVIVFEDFVGLSLKQFIASNPSVNSKEEILSTIDVAIQMVQCVDAIHKAKFTHRDLNPNNILINPETKKLKVIDFGLAVENGNNKTLKIEQQEIEGTFAYISPEQTGRVNRKVGYHSDFYSLGVSLYELFSGNLPFHGENLREWVHYHIAKEAIPLNITNPSIPKAIAQIIAKLMNKNAEERYQSTYGILQDLQWCNDEVRIGNKLDDFTPATKDVITHFKFPEKLYGRESEEEELIEYYNEVRKGQPAFVFIKGEPGIGKSVFVAELYKRVIEHNGRYVKSKFYQLSKEQPYTALIDAFTQLVNKMLAEDEQVLSRWKNSLLESLHNNAQLLIDVIPELELVIGEQISVPALGAIETKQRFIVSFKSFVSSFISQDEPLLVFLENLQWADTASLELIQNILSDNDIGAVMFVGTYRINELVDDNQLLHSVETMLRSEVKTYEIQLNPLSDITIEKLVIDAYGCDRNEAKELASICHRKTGGVPFFINEFLNNLNRNKYIYFDDNSGQWECDIEKVEATKVTANIVDSVNLHILELSSETQYVLKAASCVGAVFSATQLSHILNIKLDEILLAMDSALSESLILPVEDTYAFVESDENVSVEYGFLHERVRQSIYQLLSEDERAGIHRKIGWLLYKSIPDLEFSEDLFRTVAHLNEGFKFIKAENKELMAELNYLAGTRAKSSGAFKLSFNYFKKGLLLLNETGWSENYDLNLALHTQSAETAYLVGEYDQMNKFLAEVLKFSSSLVDQAGVWQTKILAQIAMHKHDIIEKDTFSYLKKLGVNFPEKVNYGHVMVALLKTTILLRSKRKVLVSDLKPVNDPLIKTAMDTMGIMVYPLYGGNPKLFILVILKLLQLTYKHGTVAISPISFMMYGMLLNAMFGKIERGYSLGIFGLKLLKQINDKKHWAEISVCNNLGVKIWKEPIKNATEGLIEDYKIALETGDIEFAVSSLSSCSNYLFFQGKSLDEINDTTQKYNRYLSHIPHSEGRRIMDMQLQTIINLQEISDNPDVLIGRAFNEEEFLSSGKVVGDSVLTNLYFLKLFNAFVFGQYDKAYEHAMQGRKVLKGVAGILHHAMFIFYESLAYASYYHQLPSGLKAKALRRINKNLKKLRKWANHSPMTFENKYLLVKAEYFRLIDDFKSAENYYDLAIEEAEKNQFIHEEAISNELAGKYWQNKEKPKFARIYLAKAYELYNLWNAHAKVKHFECQNSDIITRDFEPSSKSEGTYTQSSNGTLSSGSIDLKTIVDVAQTLSGEIVLGNLLSKTLKIILEHAGAQKGVLLIKDMLTKELAVEGEGEVGKDGIVIKAVKKDLMSAKLPRSVIRYVERSKTILSLKNAHQIGNYQKDPYIVENKVESLIALPIVHQARLLGVIYLENNLAVNVFNEKQNIVLKLLSTQLAISLENARIYGTLEQKVNERTTEVEKQKQEIHLQAKTLEKQNDDLNKLNKTKDKLFSIIGHDLRNPFNSIIGFSKMIVDGVHKMTKEDVLCKADLIYNSSIKTYELLQNLLEWSKMQMGGTELSPKEVKLLDLVENNIRLHFPAAEAKQITLIKDINEELIVFADIDMLNAVLRNLISNAIKFTHNHGEIVICSVHEEEFEEVIVTDNGVGIEPDKLDRIFTLDKNLVTQGTNNEGGTGLGLILCKDFVEKNGGEISVESVHGSGTKFIFTIPTIKDNAEG